MLEFHRWRGDTGEGCYFNDLKLPSQRTDTNEKRVRPTLLVLVSHEQCHRLCSALSPYRKQSLCERRLTTRSQLSLLRRRASSVLTEAASSCTEQIRSGQKFWTWQTVQARFFFFLMLQLIIYSQTPCTYHSFSSNRHTWFTSGWSAVTVTPDDFSSYTQHLHLHRASQSTTTTTTTPQWHAKIHQHSLVIEMTPTGRI